MSNHESLPRLDLNVAQWRQDVQTFATSTEQELVEITDQLSELLAGPGDTSSSAGRPAANNSTSESKSEQKTDYRLSELKQRLASRIK